LSLDVRSELAQLFNKPWTVAGDILQHYFQNKTGYWVQIACEGLATKPQGFKGDRTASGERIDNKSRFLAVRSLNEDAGNLNIRAMGSVIPICEFRYKFEQRVAKICI
jgi:hypothetical protein